MTIKQKQRTCPECSNKFMPFQSFQNVCTDSKCMLSYASKAREAKRLKDIGKIYNARGSHSKRKTKDIESSSITTRKNAAKKACHAYIRARDKHKPCICCNKPLSPDYQAGHWIPSGQNPQVRYDEDNIHGQNLNCNYFKGGDSGDYENNLVMRIGQDRVDRLKSMKGGVMKRTAQDYKEIEVYYKEKLKQLENE